MGLDCKGGGGSGDRGRSLESRGARLTWVLRLYEHEAEPIIKTGSANKDTYITLALSDAREKLWPFLLDTKKQELEIHLLEESDTILIELKELTPVMDVRRGNAYSEETTSFHCDLSGLRRAGKGELLIYRGGTENVSGGLFSSKGLFTMKVSISLGNCDFKAGREKAECSLKVVTGSDLKN